MNSVLSPGSSSMAVIFISILGAVLFFILWWRERAAHRLSIIDGQFAHKNEIELVQAQLQDQQDELRDSERALIEAQSRVKYLDERARERALDFEKSEQVLRSAARSEFESLSIRMLEQQSLTFQGQAQNFGKQSEKNLEQLLAPFKERLKDFEKKVDESYQSEGKERHLLKAEVERMILLNERMSQEANHLTQALKGNSKSQGDWGELVLERVLETSGLREGIEYTTQANFTSEEGKNYRPDVVILLPDHKQIIVDSKVSLRAYELYSRAETEADKALHLKAHLESMMNHVNELSEKHYSRLKGIKSPEFVFLFAAVEPAFLLAMQKDPELPVRAWKKGIAIVTATTLFTSLKTVASIWRLEHQSRNAQEIAQEAAKLYDKFVSFHEDFEKLGRSLEVSVSQFDDARRKLREGPGNVFKKIEALRELGAAPQKRLRPDLLE